MQQFSDAHILHGLSDIVNPENIKPGINLRELEQQMINGGVIKSKLDETHDRLSEELESAARELGIDFDIRPTKKKDETKNWRAQNYTSQSFANNSGEQNNFESDSDEDVKYGENESHENDHAQYLPEENANTWSQKNTPPSFSGSNYSDSYARIQPNSDFFTEPSYSQTQVPKSLQYHTKEQENKELIKSVIGEGSQSISFEEEKREDIKCEMLDEIDSLISSLKDDNVDLSRIPEVNKDSSFTDVRTVLKMLRHKNDHSRYCSLADEFLIFGATALEELFDGERTWFGRYRPDLRGWHNNVNAKLHRMRYDTGQVVSNVMQDYNIGPGARLLLELIPNMLMYSRLKSEQKNKPNIQISEDEIRAAHEDIRRNNGL